MEVRVGSKWKGSERNSFVVEDVKVLNDQTWVHYAKADKFGFASDQKFSCLAGAFEVRFSPCVD